MARRRVKANNLEALGDWLLEYWERCLSRTEGEAKPLANPITLKQIMEFNADDNEPVFCYDDEKTIHIVIPHCPWTLEDVQEMRKNCNCNHYKYELGFVMRGGCR
jgi:hypothetical protein